MRFDLPLVLLEIMTRGEYPTDVRDRYSTESLVGIAPELSRAPLTVVAIANKKALLRLNRAPTVEQFAAKWNYSPELQSQCRAELEVDYYRPCKSTILSEPDQHPIVKIEVGHEEI